MKGPFDIAMNNSAKCFYVATNSAHTITKITSSGICKASVLFFLLASLFYVFLSFFLWSVGIVSPFAGSGQQGSSDGVGSNASFNYPTGIVIDQHTDNLFVIDYNNHSIRKITPQGVCIKTCL